MSNERENFLAAAEAVTEGAMAHINEVLDDLRSAVRTLETCNEGLAEKLDAAGGELHGLRELSALVSDMDKLLAGDGWIHAGVAIRGIIETNRLLPKAPELRKDLAAALSRLAEIGPEHSEFVREMSAAHALAVRIPVFVPDTDAAETGSFELRLYDDVDSIMRELFAATGVFDEKGKDQK